MSAVGEIVSRMDEQICSVSDHADVLRLMAWGLSDINCDDRWTRAFTGLADQIERTADDLFEARDELHRLIQRPAPARKAGRQLTVAK